MSYCESMRRLAYQIHENISLPIPHLREDYQWTCHLDPIYDLSEELMSSETAEENARYLAGCSQKEIAILLLEPADCSEELNPKAMVDATDTLKYLDEVLETYTNKHFNLDNTSVLDMYLLRPRSTLRFERSREKVRKDTLAVDTMLEILETLQPKVVLVCHCTAPPCPGPARLFCSRTKLAGTQRQFYWENGRNTTIIYSFHPSTFLTKDYWKRENEKISDEDAEARALAMQMAFEACLYVALNAAIGRPIQIRDLLDGHMVDDIFKSLDRHDALRTSSSMNRNRAHSEVINLIDDDTDDADHRHASHRQSRDGREKRDSLPEIIVIDD